MRYKDYDKDLRAKIYQALRLKPLTAQQVTEKIGWGIAVVQPRFTELKLSGKIYKTGDGSFWARCDTHPDPRPVQGVLI